jgi:hypothetical protein
LYLVAAFGINDRGEITGIAFEQSNGDNPAFLAIPDPAKGNQAIASTDQRGPAPLVSVPENVRKLIQQRLIKGRVGGLSVSQ